MKYILTHILLLSFTYQAFTQSEGYWKMDSPTEIKSIFTPDNGRITFRAGYDGMAVVLNEKPNAIELTNCMDFYDEFSVSFWFNAENLMNEQTIFQQARFNKFTKKESRFIEVFIKENYAFVRTEKAGKKVCNLESLPKTEGWFWLTYTADRYGFKVYLQGQQIFESRDGTMFRELGNAEDQLILGEGKTQFIGLIDEVRVFKEILEEEDLVDIFENYQQKRLAQKELVEKSMNPEIEEKDSEKKTVFELPKKFKNRKNKAPSATVIVRSNTIDLEFWDYYAREIDGDAISIFVNKEENLVRRKAVLDKKKRKETIQIKLPKEEVSYLVFYAENTGDYYSAATVGAFIKGMNHPVEFTANRDSNAVIKIINHSRAVKAEKEKLPLVQIPEMLIEKEEIILEFTPFSAADKFEDLVVIPKKNGAVKHIKLRDEPQKVKLNLAYNESEKVQIFARALDKNEECSARLQIIENGKIISERVLNLHTETYEIALKRKPKITKIENGKRTITLPKSSEKIEELTLVISDHDKPDGDKIRLLYEDEIVLQEFTLAEDPLFRIITLKDTIQHQFTIEALDFGTSPEPINTPKIQIYSGGKLIDEFVFWLRKNGGNVKGVIDLRFHDGQN